MLPATSDARQLKPVCIEAIHRLVVIVILVWRIGDGHTVLLQEDLPLRLF
jgi:hypothetical protein